MLLYEKGDVTVCTAIRQGTGSSSSWLVSSRHLVNVLVYTNKVLFVIYLRFWLFHQQYFNREGYFF